jgi:hypothetical protein
MQREDRLADGPQPHFANDGVADTDFIDIDGGV